MCICVYTYIYIYIYMYVSQPRTGTVSLWNLIWSMYLAFWTYTHISIDGYTSIPLDLYTTIPLYLCTFIPLCLFTSEPLYLYTSISLYLYTSIPLYLYTSIPLCLYTSIPIYRLHLYTSIPLYLYTSIPMYLCTSMLLYLFIKIRWLNISGRFPMDMRIPPHRIKILLESNPLKSRILVRRLAVWLRSNSSGLQRFKLFNNNQLFWTNSKLITFYFNMTWAILSQPSLSQPSKPLIWMIEVQQKRRSSSSGWVLPSFQQPTFQTSTKHQCLSCSHFEWLSSFRVIFLKCRLLKW